jgi:DNA repair exonuclease SbcCD ATPase subunit
LSELKKEFLELLDRDIEFRYTVAGYLGLSEILKRLDALSEEQVKLREEQTKIWKEIQAIKEEQKGLREEQNSLREEQVRLREDFNEMLATIKRMDRRLTRVERTLFKLTLDVEDEARSIIRKRVKDELGFDIKLRSLILPDMEINVYGVSGDLCVVGEATVRGGAEVLRRLLRNIKRLKERYPERLRDKIIPVIYVCQPMPELVERAEKQNIWTLKATEDFHKPGTIFWSYHSQPPR